MSISGYSAVVLVVFGVLLMGAGLTLLIARPEVRRGPMRGARMAAHALLAGRLSEPSRLMIAVVLLVVGYHFLAWAAPARWDIMAVPRRRWVVVVVAGGVAVLLSLLLDRVGAGVDGPRPPAPRPPAGPSVHPPGGDGEGPRS